MDNLTAVINADRLTKLKALLAILSEAIDKGPGARDLSQLSKQYRETIREIEEIEGGPTDGDELGAILEKRKADGKPGAVRKNRTKLP